MFTYSIQTQQTYGEWLTHGEVMTSICVAIEYADIQFEKYHCPKRVICNETQQSFYTVGDTPEWQAYMARVRALLEARENPSERFNMPTAWQSRLNLWENDMHADKLVFTQYQHAAIDIIESTDGYTCHENRAEHEMTASDALGMYMMGEEL